MDKLNFEQKRALQGWLRTARKLKEWSSSNHEYASFLRGRLYGYTDVLVLSPSRLYFRLEALEMKLANSYFNERVLP
jgi:hypothetical protein